MDDINYKRRIKIFDADDFEYITEQKLICDFYSCQICHGENAIKYKPKNKERKPFNPKNKEKKCDNISCKKCNFIKELIKQQRKEYYEKKAEEEIEKKKSEKENEKSNDENKKREMKFKLENQINLINDSIDQIENKIKAKTMKDFDLDEIPGNGDCAYNAILYSINETHINQQILRNIVSEGLAPKNIDKPFLEERNIKSKQDLIRKIKCSGYYAGELELRQIAESLKIWIAIFCERYNSWTIIKHSQKEKPNKIAYIHFKDYASNYDYANHYNSLIEKVSKSKIIENKCNKSISQYQEENEFKTMIWNCRSLNQPNKKAFIADLIYQTSSEIVFIMEHWLLEEDNLYIKGFKTYKTRNREKRKGCAILISRNINASVIQKLNDTMGRYIQLSLKTPKSNKAIMLACTYLEPNGDINNIPEEIMESDIIAGDMNKADFGINREEVYHYKGIIINNKYEIKHKRISDHNVLLGKIKAPLERIPGTREIQICNKMKSRENHLILKEIIIDQLSKPRKSLIDPRETIIVKTNYIYNSNLDKYNDWEKIEKMIKEDYSSKYDRINKLMISECLNKDAWYKINNLLQTKSKKELYTGGELKDEVINYYKELFAHISNKQEPHMDIVYSQIGDILGLIRADLSCAERKPIFPPRSEAIDYYGYSQKNLERIIRANTLAEEINNYTGLIYAVHSDIKSFKYFIHGISKTVLFKKKEAISGGTDIRVINIIPAWLIILEKLSSYKVKELLMTKIDKIQFGFRENSDCNVAKLMIWINNLVTGYNKHLLIDIKKEIDIINREILKKMIINDFEGDEQCFLLTFVKFWDYLSISILGEKIAPSKGGPQGDALVPYFFCYYLDKVIKQIAKSTEIKIQAYADDIIISAKELNKLQEIYNDIKVKLASINLVINPTKCELLTEDPEDIIEDKETGILIYSKKEAKYIGQIINSKGISEEDIERKLFQKLLIKIDINKSLSTIARIKLFKIYLISKVNHLIPLTALTGNLSVLWKSIRKIIFKNILHKQTTPLETMPMLGLGYYNIIVRPLIKLIERNLKVIGDKNIYNILMGAVKKVMQIWLQFETKHEIQLKDKILKLSRGEEEIDIKVLDKLIQEEMKGRLRRKTGEELNIMDLRILKYPNVTNLLSNAPYHEIVDTIEGIQNDINRKNNHI